MQGLRQRLAAALAGRVTFVGIGNPTLGDDAAGLVLAEQLRGAGMPSVLLAGVTPERCASRLAAEAGDAVVLLDAVDMGAAPGSIVFLDAAEIVARFPQVSTHKLSLGVLAQLVRSLGGPPVYLLGIQPASLRPAPGLTPTLQTTIAALALLLGDIVRSATPSVALCGEHP